MTVSRAMDRSGTDVLHQPKESNVDQLPDLKFATNIGKPEKSETSPVRPTPVPLRDLTPEQKYFGLLQSVSTTFLCGTAQLARTVEARNQFGQNRRFEYGFRPGRPGHPLIFFIPGFGCRYEDQTGSYISQFLQSRGFHVATFHSPSYPAFLNHSHHCGIPGFTTEDGRDILTGVDAIRAQLAHEGVKFNKNYLVGYSMGALNAAFAQHVDRLAGREHFERVILINPPVDLQHGIHELDRLVQSIRTIGWNKPKLIAKVSLAILLPKLLKLNPTAQIKRFLSIPMWTENDLRALIGYSFEQTVSGGIEVAARLGHFDRDHQVTSFTEFCEQATVPRFRRYFPQATVSDLFASESLLRIGPQLARDGHMHLFHNADDFLVRPQDVAWLKQTFGAKAEIFEQGGHLGNVWRPDFQERLERALGI